MPSDALDGVQLYYIETVDEAADFMRWLGERRPILAVDTETTGLKVWKDHIRLTQFGDGMTGWTIRNDLWAGVALEAFNKYQGPYVFHNAKFDVAMLDRWMDVQIPIHRVHDTAIMARIMDPTGPRALKIISQRLISPKAAVGQTMLETAMEAGGWDWATIPYYVQAYTSYAAMDTVLTARLYDILYPQIMQMCPQAYELERTFASIIMHMEQHGSKLDRDYTQKAYVNLSQYVEDTEQWCVDNYSVKPGSLQGVVKILQDENASGFGIPCDECSPEKPGYAKYASIFADPHPYEDLPYDTCHKCFGLTLVYKRTGSGAISLDKEVLERTQHPLAKAVLNRRQAQKMTGTYLSNFLEMADENDIIRPGMDTQGAATGRMSMELFQTLPRRSEDNPLAAIARNCIVPRSGNVLMMCDFDQIEMRVLAHLAGDKVLGEAFLEGDFFNNMARQIYDDMSIVKGDHRRQMTKNTMYGKAYGAGNEKLAATAGVPIQVINDIMTKVDVLYPGIKRFQREVTAVAEQRAREGGRPFVLSPITRQPYYPKREDKVYALVNYMIQGMAASILKMKVVELNLAGLTEYFTLLIHDEVICDVPIGEARSVARTLQDTMNDSKLLTVPLTASVDIGERWGDKGKIKLEDLYDTED